MIVCHVMCAGCVEDPCIRCVFALSDALNRCVGIPNVGAWIMRMRDCSLDRCAAIHDAAARIMRMRGCSDGCAGIPDVGVWIVRIRSGTCS
jgi:hypothetical protein